MRSRGGRHGAVTATPLFAAAPPPHPQLPVLISGGFADAYRPVLPEFEREFGVSVITMSGSSSIALRDASGEELREFRAIE